MRGTKRIVHSAVALAVLMVGGRAAVAQTQLIPRYRLPKPVETLVDSRHHPGRFVVKFRDDLPVTLNDATGIEFEEGALSAEETSAVELVSTYGAWSRPITASVDGLRRVRDTAIRNSGREIFDFTTLFSFELTAPDEAVVAQLCDQLNVLEVIEFALPVPNISMDGLSGGGDHGEVGGQGGDAPGDLTEASSPASYPSNDPRAAWDRRGIVGEGVAIWVVDYHMAREATNNTDLPVHLADVPVFTGQHQHFGVTYNNSTDGAAEAVRLAGAPRDGIGIEGPAFSSQYYFTPIVWSINALNEEFINPPNAILEIATNGNVRPGDIILIPMVAAGPASDVALFDQWGIFSPPEIAIPTFWAPDNCAYEAGTVPLEWNYFSWEAMRQAFFNDILVVEAAGDGGVLLDDPVFNFMHHPFSQNPSHALIVTSTRADSNVGSRINFYDDWQPPQSARNDCSEGSPAATARVAAKAALLQSQFKLIGASEADFDPALPKPDPVPQDCRFDHLREEGKTYLTPVELTNCLHAGASNHIQGRGNEINVLDAADELLKTLDEPRVRFQTLLPNLQLLSMSGPAPHNHLFLGQFDPDDLPTEIDLRIYNDSDVKQCVAFTARSLRTGLPEEDLDYRVPPGPLVARTHSDITITVPGDAPSQVYDELIVRLNDSASDPNCTDETTWREFIFRIQALVGNESEDRHLTVRTDPLVQVPPNGFVPFVPIEEGETSERVFELALMPGFLGFVDVWDISLVGPGPFEVLPSITPLPTPFGSWRVTQFAEPNFKVRLNGTERGEFIQLLRIKSFDPEVPSYDIYLAARVEPEEGGIVFEHLGGRQLTDGLIDLGQVDFSQLDFPWEETFHRFNVKILGDVVAHTLFIEDLDVVPLPPMVGRGVSEGLSLFTLDHTIPPNTPQDVRLRIQQSQLPEMVGWFKGGVVANYNDATGRPHEADFGMTFTIYSPTNLPVSIESLFPPEELSGALPGPASAVENGGVIDFGTVDRGAEATRQVVLTNVTTSPIRVDGAAVEDGPFALLTEFPTSEIPPGGEVEALIGLDTSRNGDFEGRLGVYFEGSTSTLANPFVTARLTATVQPGSTRVLEARDGDNNIIRAGGTLDFGELPVEGSSSEWTRKSLVLKNIGSQRLNYSIDVDFPPGTFSPVTSHSGGILDPNELKIVGYYLNQANEGEFLGRVTIQNTGSNPEFTVFLRGVVDEGAPGPGPGPGPGPPTGPPNLPTENPPVEPGTLRFAYREPFEAYPTVPTPTPYNAHLANGGVLDLGEWPVGTETPIFYFIVQNYASPEREIQHTISEFEIWDPTLERWRVVWYAQEYHGGGPYPPGEGFRGLRVPDDWIDQVHKFDYGNFSIVEFRFEPQWEGLVVGRFNMHYFYEAGGQLMSDDLYLYLRGYGIPDESRAEVRDSENALVSSGDSVGLGPMSMSCPAPIRFRLGNAGSQDLLVSDFSVSGGDFSLSTPAPEGALGPGESLPFALRLQPGGERPVEGEVSFSTSQPDVPLYSFDLVGQTVDVPLCTPSATTLCLQNRRFSVTLDYVDHHNGDVQGQGKALPSTNQRTGFFWFFNQNNIEVAVKVLDGRAVNDFFWVFHGGLTDLGYTLTVSDAETDRVEIFQNPRGGVCGGADTTAFPGDCAVPLAEGVGEDGVEIGDSFGLAVDSSRVPPFVDVESLGSCEEGPETLCLQNGRFEVEVDWHDANSSTSGSGTAHPFTGTTGRFSFFNPNNIELLVKILDGRPLNGYFWVFIGSLSTVEYTVTITDTETDTVRIYTNDFGTYCGQRDINAFDDEGDPPAAPGLQVEAGVDPVPPGATHDFGSTGTGQPVTRTFTLRNTGSTELHLSALDLTGGNGGFSLVDPSPIDLPPGGTRAVVVKLNATSPGTFSRDLEIASDDPATPYRVHLAGEVEEPEECEPDSTTLCLVNDRFQVTVDYVDHHNGGGGAAKKIEHSNRTGLFYFSSSSNIEMIVKVLGPSNGHWWVFHGGLTSLAYTVTVRDMHTGQVVTYSKSAGNLCGNGDTSAFPSPFAGDPEPDPLGVAEDGEPTLVPIPAAGSGGAAGTCDPSTSRLCLLDDRFAVEVDYEDLGMMRPAKSTPYNNRMGSFWFYNSSNLEVPVKILNGTPVNGYYWVFIGSLTNVDHEVTITDTVTGTVREYPSGADFCGTADTTAYPGP